MQRRFTTAALVLGAVLGVTASAGAQVLPHRPIVDRLPNGLTVVTLPYDAPGIAAYYTLVRTGSRDEVEPGHSGFAHLFEHMMFRGTRQLSATEYEHRMQALGADNNAYTTEDFTMYTITLPAASLPELIPIEADRFQHLSYDEPTFQTEARAVLGEYNKNASNPLMQMWESLAEQSFTRHTYGHTTMGYLRDIQAMPREYRYSQAFFQRFYTPDNTTIIVAGDVQRDRVLPLIQQHYGAWSGRRAQPAIQPEPEQSTPRRRDLAWTGGPTPRRLLVGYRIPAFGTATNDTAALEVVHALAFSESSELYQRLVVREQRLISLESWRADFHRDPQLFVIEARLAQGTSFDEVIEAITAELARIGRGETSADRLRDVISNLRYALPMEVQTPSDAANMLGRFMALTGDPDTLEQYHSRLASVTPEDVARVARTYLVPARSNTITLSPAADAPAGAERVGPAATPARPAPRTRPSGARGAVRSSQTPTPGRTR